MNSRLKHTRAAVVLRFPSLRLSSSSPIPHPLSLSQRQPRALSSRSFTRSRESVSLSRTERSRERNLTAMNGQREHAGFIRVWTRVRARSGGSHEES